MSAAFALKFFVLVQSVVLFLLRRFDIVFSYLGVYFGRFGVIFRTDIVCSFIHVAK